MTTAPAPEHAPAARLDADVGDALAAGLLGPPPRDLVDFEQRFMAEVELQAPDRDSAWDAFYDATLHRVCGGWGRALPGTGTVATFTRIWSRAAGLQRGRSALDVGTCFGFLPLAWAEQPASPQLVAVDVSPQSAALLGRQARRRGARVDVLCTDGARLPLRDRALDTVHLLHVLEHLPAPVGEAVLAEALRVARGRVVVAVPFEARPDPVFGHVRVFDLSALADLGRWTGWDVQVSSADGGWLVLDRPAHISSRPSWPER